VLWSKTRREVGVSVDGRQLRRPLSVDVAQKTGVLRVGQVEQSLTQLTQRVLGRQMQQRRRLAVQPLYSVVVTTVKAKFHYDILVADRSEAGRRLVADLLARA